MRDVSFSRRVFVDTSAYYSATVTRDRNHGRASVTMEHLILTHRPLVTTNFVLAELHGLLVSRTERTLAVDALTRIKASPLTTFIRVQEEDEDRAWAIVTQYDDKDFSLTDAISFAVMERLGLRTAFAFDRHFEQFGWDVIPRPTSSRR